MFSKSLQILVSALLPLAAIAAPTTTASAPVTVTTCVGQTYVYNELAGYGFIPNDARDKFGDTIGGIGSAIALKSWVKLGNSYEGIVFVQPDRGWNTNGTINFIPRVHKFLIRFTPKPGATVQNPSGPNIDFTYLDTILLRAPDGTPCTGLDADGDGYITYPGFPQLPVATYTGDGFGGPGPGGKRIPIDAEGLFLAEDGSWWTSDEYGPYIYHFNADGIMIEAIRPVDAILPLRNGSVSFSADSPYEYIPESDDVSPANPTQGRQNNQGFEGLTVSPDGKNLYALLQSACEQEGGAHSADRRYPRLVHYQLPQGGIFPHDGNWKRAIQSATYVGEYVVPLPLYTSSSGSSAVAAQSELHYLSPTQFLFLPRDSKGGHGQASSQSLFRHADIFDISGATNVAGATYDSFNASIASSKGELNAGITPATYCSFIDFNINAQLNRFGVHNGGNQDNTLLNEKWESLALAPVNGGSFFPFYADLNSEYFLLSMSDNDFITQNGKTSFLSDTGSLLTVNRLHRWRQDQIQGRVRLQSR